MSKLNVRFIYTGQFRSNVRELQRGPVRLDNIYNSYLHPEYEDIRHEDSQPSSNPLPPISHVEMNSKPNSPNSLTRNKSPDMQRANLLGESTSIEDLRPALNIEAMNESQFNRTTTTKDKKKQEQSLQIAEQVLLQAPSFRFQPKEEGSGARGGKHEFQKADKTEKYLYKGIPEKTEDDFVGCFGCMEPKPKAYATNNKK